MTATLHKITAGDGYLYYTRQVAAQDVSSRGNASLGDYYSARGESPGRWFGSGLRSLAVTYRDEVVADSQIDAGSVVTEEQMESLFGLGQHPNAGQIRDHIVAVEVTAGAKRRNAMRAAKQATLLGAPFRVYDGASEYRQRCAKAFADYNTALGLRARAAVPDHERAEIRTEIAQAMFRERFARPPLDERELSGWVARISRRQSTAVAGFDWTFSPVKSVSTLWALAPLPIAEGIERAHHAAVAIAIRYLEEHATFTRLGRNGVRQVEVEGLVCAVFDHRDARSGDPDLHTHVVAANRVRTRDGLWRTIDGSMFYRVAVSASEIYNTALEMVLLRDFSDAERHLYGIEFAERPSTDPSKRPVREIVGVPRELLEFWSQRDAAITIRLDELTIAFQRFHGRAPRPDEMFKLTQQAILDTRPDKKEHRSWAEQRAEWHRQAVLILGSPEAVDRMLTEALRMRPLPRPAIDAEWIGRHADQVIATISAERSSWQYSHVRSEAERVVRGRVMPDQWVPVTEAIVSEALAPTRSIARGDPDLGAEPVLREVPRLFQRDDGASVYTTVASQSYTSPKTLAVEAHLIELVQESGGRTLPPALVDDAVRAFGRERGTRLNQDQITVVRRFASSGRRIDIANAPAGAGKTTAMGVLADAWRAGGGTVLGLAPTAAAAQELGEDIRARTDTVDKLLTVLDAHTPTPQRVAAEPEPPGPLPQWVLDIDDRTLVIVDEHVRITDDKRLRALMYLVSRGATIRFLGDLEQLPAIGAGGAAADIIDAADAVTLSSVVRFADPAEGAASLLLREGDPAGLGYYVDRGRVHVGSPAVVTDLAYAAWAADIAAGRDAVLLAPTHTVVKELNERARADRLARAEGLPEREVALTDGLAASVGDTICTTRNNRRLTLSDRDFVRNGYRWQVTGVGDDGSLTAVRIVKGRPGTDTVTLPADYTARHVRLGYAATIDSAQGITADTCHTALRGGESRDQLYVALTRGRHGNHLYLTTTIDGEEISFFTDAAAFPRTAVEILIAILGRRRARTSAHAELRDALDPLLRLGRAIDIFLDALGMAIEHALGPAALASIDDGAEHLHPGLTGCLAWPVLRQHLATIALGGNDPISALRDAIQARELGTAKDVAAVLDWRLDSSGAHSVPEGPLPWLPGIPDTVRADTDVASFLDARLRIVADLATGIRATAAVFTPATAPVWARPLLGADPRLLADLTVWRAGNHIEPADTRPTGPARYIAVERRHQLLLDARVTEAIGDIHLPTTKWEPVVKRIETRIVADPYWPILADRLETAARAGIDVDAMLTAAAALRPLPDELPAAALWSRLDLEPSAMAGASTVRPDWLPDLIAVLGTALADRVLADPAWPKVVAAVDSAAETDWTPRELLDTAGQLLDTASARGDSSDVVRPDQLATALAWCIDAVLHHVPTHPPPPAEDEQAPTEPPYPDPALEETHMPDTEPPLPPPDPDPAVPAAVTDPETALPEEIRAVAALVRAGATRTSAMELKRLLAAATPNERATIMRVAKTLETYPFVIARARLHAAARDHPDQRALITACTPDTDPGVYQPTENPTPPRRPEPRRAMRWPRPPADETERRTMRRILRTLETYPFREATLRLRAAARDLPEHRQLILDCLPDTDPGLYQPTHRATDARPPHGRPVPARDDTSRIDPARRIPSGERKGTDRVVDDYFATQSTDYIVQPSSDDRTRHDEYTTPPPEPASDTKTRTTPHDTPEKSTPTPGTRIADHQPAYGSGESQRVYEETLRGLACVSCMLERPVTDTGLIRTAHRHTTDDGLCSDCRDAGEPGIPDHHPRDHIRARCEFITATRTPHQARALLQRDFHNARALAIRLAIADWVDKNLPAEPAPPAPDPDQTTNDPLHALTDTELDELALDLQQRIQLADGPNAVLTDPSLLTTTTIDGPSADDLAAMRTAITTALDKKADHAAKVTELQHTRSALATARNDLANASRLARTERRDIEHDLKTLTLQHDRLQSQLEYARQAWRDARRDAVLLAGPEDEWDHILHATTPDQPAQTTAAPTATASAQRRIVEERADLRRELGALQAEQTRRAALTPEQRAHEHLPNGPLPEPESTPELSATPDGTAVDSPEAGL